ncbi:kelch-like protein 23 [Oculina patagonica]
MGALLSRCKCSQLPHTTDADPAETEQGDTTKVTELELLMISQKLESEKLEEPNIYSISLAETLNSFRHQELFVDFKITASGKDFLVHKNVLAASCKFFRDLFKVSEAAVRYELANVKPSAVEDVLNFLYTGKCRLQGQQNAESALRVADILGIRDLQEALQRYLSSANETSEDTGIHEEFIACREGSVLQGIMEFWAEGLFCDLTLTTNCGRIVPVHKNVLAAVSCYFQGLFRSDMKEVHENNVDFGMISETVVNELLNFIYSGKISITSDNVRSLLQASDYLLIDHLRTTIVASFKGSNFWHIFDLLKSFSCPYEINADVLQWTRSHYWEITQSDEFLDITEEDLKWFLSNDDIVCSETQMLESLIRWYKYSKPQREESFQRLLCLVHMTSIPDLYLKFLAEREGIEDLLYSYTGHQLREKVPLDELKRTAHFYNLVVFGFSRDPDCLGNRLFYWLPFAGPWSYITPPYSFQRNSPVIYTGDALFLQWYGFHPHLTYFSNPLSAKHFKHDSSLCSATLIEHLSDAPQECTAVALGSCIYLIGGTVRHKVSSTVQRFNMEKQSWEPVSSMQEPRIYHSAINYRDRYIYVFGGLEGRACVNSNYKSTVERYDPEEDSWSFVAPMQQPRRNGLACVLVDKIFVIGGESAECACAPKCEVYDPITDVWQMGCFQIIEAYTVKACRDTGTFRLQMFSNEGSSGSSITTEPDPLELKVCIPQDEALYDHNCLHRPSVTCCNGSIIIFDFGSFLLKNLRLPFYFVDPETGHFRILYSLPSWPSETSHGIIMPLSRRDMMKALEDYPGNIC